MDISEITSVLINWLKTEDNRVILLLSILLIITWAVVIPTLWLRCITLQQEITKVYKDTSALLHKVSITLEKHGGILAQIARKYL